MISTKIGYLTDIHLRKEVHGTSAITTRHCRKMAELLPLCLAGMCRESVDMIVCTGDVVDCPSQPEVIQDLKFCKKLFDDCCVPYTVLPGNHDPLPDDFYRIFPKPDKKVMLNNCELITFYEDACFNGEPASRRSKRSLHEMKEFLIQTECSAEATVLLQHYVVYPEHNETYPHNYQNDGEIRNIMERSNRLLFSISGHYHPGIPMTQKNGVSYFAGRAFCEEPYAFYIISFSRNETFIEEREIKEGLQ